MKEDKQEGNWMNITVNSAPYVSNTGYQESLIVWSCRAVGD